MLFALSKAVWGKDWGTLKILDFIIELLKLYNPENKRKSTETTTFQCFSTGGEGGIRTHVPG